jgi:hypothetical protein
MNKLFIKSVPLSYLPCDWEQDRQTMKIGLMKGIRPVQRYWLLSGYLTKYIIPCILCFDDRRTKGIRPYNKIKVGGNNGNIQMPSTHDTIYGRQTLSFSLMVMCWMVSQPRKMHKNSSNG